MIGAVHHTAPIMYDTFSSQELYFTGLNSLPRGLVRVLE